MKIISSLENIETSDLLAEPLAAVMFVAETTGRPNFIVPALFAAVAAELVMGEQSITAYQRRPGQL